MSDTPITDAEMRKPENSGRVNAVIGIDFARQLERETVTLQQRVDELGAALDSACVEMRAICSRDPLHGKNLTTLKITHANCEEVLRRHGIRTGDQAAATKP